jgi:hypothetical protein
MHFIALKLFAVKDAIFENNAVNLPKQTAGFKDTVLENYSVPCLTSEWVAIREFGVGNYQFLVRTPFLVANFPIHEIFVFWFIFDFCGHVAPYQ